MVAGALRAAAMMLVLYRLAHRLGGRVAATAAATAFLHLCAFGHLYFKGIFNWVLPYTYAATYGMLAATTSLCTPRPPRRAGSSGRPCPLGGVPGARRGCQARGISARGRRAPGLRGDHSPAPARILAGGGGPRSPSSAVPGFHSDIACSTITGGWFH
jgi:hypothetical protein